MEDDDVDDTVYFPYTWERETVYFEYNRPDPRFLVATWKLGKKLHERPRLATNWEYSEGVVSESEAMFECANTRNENDTALMQIYMQVPRRGTEFLSPGDRMKQATDELNPESANQFWALVTLRKQDSRFCPKIYDYKKTTQDESGLVPKGYILYLVVRELPGISLTNDLFWRLPLLERSQIREAFRAAFLDCLEKGIKSFEHDVSKLRWVEEAKQV